MMIPTINEDIVNICNEFKLQVNKEFKPTGSDIAKIKNLMKNHCGGRANKNGGDILYYQLDYDGLKRHRVKDFSFSIEEYEDWQEETFKLLKDEAIQRRNTKYAKR